MNAFSLENLHINMCMQIHSSFVTDFPSCYIMGFLGEVKPFLSSGDMGELEEGDESTDKINPNIAYFALAGSSSVSQHC